MANRLKAYVRRTILQSATEGAWPKKRRTAESTRTAFTDAMRGTDTGWWSDLIYTAGMLEMAHRYRRDIAVALDEYQDACGEPYRSYNGESADRILSGLLRGPHSFEAYKDEPENGPADLSLLGLRFAVEWYAGDLARDLCPDL